MERQLPIAEIAAAALRQKATICKVLIDMVEAAAAPSAPAGFQNLRVALAGCVEMYLEVATFVEPAMADLRVGAGVDNSRNRTEQPAHR